MFVGFVRFGFGKAAAPDTCFVKQDKRYGKQGLGNHVRRGNDGGNDECADNDVGSCVFELFGGYDADLGKQDDDDGDFESRAECNEHAQNKGQVFVDVGRHVDTDGGDACEEFKDDGENEVVGKRHADKKQADAGEDKRGDQAFFVLIEGGRDECPDLIERVRQGNEECRHQRHFHRHEKRCDDVGGNHAGVFGKIHHQWFGNKGVKLLGKRHHAEKADDDADDDPHQAAAQLDKVFDKRLDGLFVLRFGHRFTHFLRTRSLGLA